jgi:hypothetical protein
MSRLEAVPEAIQDWRRQSQLLNKPKKHLLIPALMVHLMFWDPKVRHRKLRRLAHSRKKKKKNLDQA